MTSVGERIGRYVVVRPLGDDTAWLAFDPALQRRVALEVASVGETSLDRLAAARTIAKLDHPALVAVHDVGETDGVAFVACEYVAGVVLERAAVRAAPGELERWFADLAQGLAVLHAAGVAHRGLDLPGSLGVEAGRVRLGGFSSAAMLPLGDPAFAADVAAVRGRMLATLEAARGASRRLSGAFAAVAPQAAAQDLARALAPTPTRRAWRALAGFAAVGAVVGLVGVGRRLAEGEATSCESTGARIEGVWDDAAVDRLRAAFVASGSPIADESAQSAVRAIDAWAARYGALRSAACVATNRAVASVAAGGSGDAVMICLDRRRGELAALLAVLGQADAPMVARAIDAIGQLPAVEECEGATAELGATADPAVRSTVAEVDAILAESRALLSAGLYARAVDRITAVREREDVGRIDPGRRAQLQLVLGTARGKAGRGEVAIDDLVEGVSLAWQAASPGLVAEAWGEVGFVLAEHLKRPDDALLAIDLAEAAAEAAPPNDRARAARLQTRGVALLVALRHADAEVALDEANRLTMALPGEEFVRGSILNSLANAELGQRRFADAQAHYREALDVYAGILGRDHPNIASVYNNMCAAYYRESRSADALAACLESHRMRVATLGEEHPDTVATLENYGVLLGGDGRYEEAVVVLAQTLETRKRILPPNSPGLADSFVNYGDALLGTGRGAAARDAFERALAIDLATVGEQHYSTSVTLQNLGRALEVERRPADALAAYERALAIRDGLSDVHPFSLVDTLVHIVEAAHAAGDRARATAALARVEGIVARDGPFPEFVELLEFARGRERVLAGDRVGGLAALTALLDRGLWPPLRERIAAWIAAQSPAAP